MLRFGLLRRRSLRGLLNGPLHRLLNGPLRGLLNGPLRRLLNAPLRRLLNGPLYRLLNGLRNRLLIPFGRRLRFYLFTLFPLLFSGGDFGLYPAVSVSAESRRFFTESALSVRGFHENYGYYGRRNYK